MQKLGIPEDIYIPLLRAGGFIEILQVIPVEEIVKKGIPYVRFHLMKEKDMNADLKKKFSEFWRYFINTWTKTYDPTTWNYYGLDDESILVNRTNNPLERYNRRLKEQLGHHPSMMNFIAGIKLEAQHFLEELQLISSRKKSAPERMEIILPTIPDDYWTYNPLPCPASATANDAPPRPETLKNKRQRLAVD